MTAWVSQTFHLFSKFNEILNDYSLFEISSWFLECVFKHI